MNVPLRVLVVSPHPVQYAAPMYRRMQEDPRIDLTVAYRSMRGAEAQIDPDFGVEVQWDVPLLDGYRWVRLRGADGVRITSDPSLWSLITHGDFDAVVYYGYRERAFLIARLATWLRGSALLLSNEAASFTLQQGTPWKASIKRRVLPLVFRLANGVMASSSRAATFLHSIGVRADQVFLVPYTVDVDAFRAARVTGERRAKIRRSWGADDSSLVVLLAAKLVPWKRPMDSLEAVAPIDEAHLVIAGDGPLRASIEQRVEQLAMHDRVTMLGFVNQSQMPEVYSSADVLLLPSEYDGFGLVVAEAEASGIPVIATDAVGATDDLIEDGVSGSVVHVGDVASMSRAIEELVSRERRRAVSEAAEAMIARWTPKQHIEAFLHACETVHRAGGGRAAAS